MTPAASGAAPSVSSSEFAAQTEQQQVSALRALAASALEAWSFERPALELVKYRENAVFCVRSADGERAILRVHRPRYRSDLDICCELAWMKALDEAGVPAPRAIATRSGELVCTASAADVPEPRQCDVLAWIDGAAPGTLEGGVAASDAELRTLYRSVGAVAARMHELVGHWQRPQPFSRPSWNVETLIGDEPTFGRFEELDVMTSEQLEVLVAAREIARRRLAGLGPAALLIHGDLVPDNILIDGDVQRIIDFDDFGWSWNGFELATSLFPLQVSGGFDAGLEGYLEGYCSLREFPDHELEALPDLLIARGLSYLGWPVGRPEIASARDLAPFFAAMMADAAVEYVKSRG